MTEPIGVGLIGANPRTAWAAFAHIPALQALPQFELRALATSRPESAAEAEQAFGVKTYVGHEGVLSHPGVDLVVVAVRTPNHKAVLQDVLAAGKDVYCEWPLGNGAAEAAELNAAAEQAGVRTFMGLQARSSPPLQHMRELIADGYVGRVLSTSMVGTCWVYGASTMANNAYQLQKANGASMLTIQVAHAYDAMGYVLGQELSDVVASFATVRPQVTVEETGETLASEVPDQIALSGVLEGGGVASLHVKGGLSRASNMQWVVSGDEGDLLLDGTGIHLSTDDAGPPRLLGARGEATAVEPLELPAKHRWIPDEIGPGPAQNVAQHYALVAKDLREGTQEVPSFAHAVRRQTQIELIDGANASGERRALDAAAATA